MTAGMVFLSWAGHGDRVMSSDRRRCDPVEDRVRPERGALKDGGVVLLFGDGARAQICGARRT
ncbi:hypothetical protein ASF21_07490 [Arthrobacter sp. Leaf234]|nr:hypothetical protein ASF21_07490 [Arthrobacter sp. Leaf234]